MKWKILRARRTKAKTTVDHGEINVTKVTQQC